MVFLRTKNKWSFWVMYKAVVLYVKTTVPRSISSLRHSQQRHGVRQMGWLVLSCRLAISYPSLWRYGQGSLQDHKNDGYQRELLEAGICELIEKRLLLIWTCAGLN